jgi:hypothetical protein
MENDNHLLTIRLEGSSIASGRIPIDLLVKLLSELNKSLIRTGMVLQGDADSIRRGKKPSSLKASLALDLVSISHGSPATILSLERTRSQKPLPGIDIGIEILEKSISGLNRIQVLDNELPEGFDQGVLLAWRDVGFLLELGVREMTFKLNHRKQPVKSVYTLNGFQNIQQRIHGPLVNVRTVEGRLLMADFKEHGTRCRIHPSIGDPILCLFNDEQKEEVLENILHYVKIVGEAKEDPFTKKISSIKIADIRRLEEYEGERTDLLPEGTPLPSDFWYSPTIEELAEAQNILPIESVEMLFGTWPGDIDDGFEESVHALRQFGIDRGN